MSEHEEKGSGLSEELKGSFFGDLLYSMLQPGYIGKSSIVVINIAFLFFTLTVVTRLYVAGFNNIENYAHAFALVPLIGLWFSINWFVMEMSTPENKTESLKAKTKKKKKSKKQKRRRH